MDNILITDPNKVLKKLQRELLEPISYKISRPVDDAYRILQLTNDLIQRNEIPMEEFSSVCRHVFIRALRNQPNLSQISVHYGNIDRTKLGLDYGEIINLRKEFQAKEISPERKKEIIDQVLKLTEEFLQEFAHENVFKINVHSKDKPSHTFSKVLFDVFTKYQISYLNDYYPESLIPLNLLEPFMEATKYHIRKGIVLQNKSASIIANHIKDEIKLLHKSKTSYRNKAYAITHANELINRLLWVLKEDVMKSIDKDFDPIESKDNFSWLVNLIYYDNISNNLVVDIIHSIKRFALEEFPKKQKFLAPVKATFEDFYNNRMNIMGFMEEKPASTYLDYAHISFNDISGLYDDDAETFTHWFMKEKSHFFTGMNNLPSAFINLKLHALQEYEAIDKSIRTLPTTNLANMAWDRYGTSISIASSISGLVYDLLDFFARDQRTGKEFGKDFKATMYSSDDIKFMVMSAVSQIQLEEMEREETVDEIEGLSLF